jgi:hypothetical protein
VGIDPCYQHPQVGAALFRLFGDNRNYVEVRNDVNELSVVAAGREGAMVTLYGNKQC